MERYHKSYRIISRSDRDPENNLFRALITIETSPVPVYRKYNAMSRTSNGTIQERTRS